MIVIRILAFLGIFAAIVAATFWKVEDVKQRRSRDVVTIQSEYQEYGRPVVTFRVGPGNLHRYEKVTFRKLTPTTLETEVPANIARKVERGQRIDFINYSSKGQIVSVASGPDLLTGLFKVRASLRPEDEALPGELIGRIEIQKSRVDVRVPRNAVTKEKNNDYVWLVKDGRAMRTPITLGSSDEMFYQVKKGLNLGDQIVWKGQSYLEDQQLVRPVATELNATFEIAKKK